MVRNENYIVIQGYMINELELKGNELLIYAIINGFSQKQEQFFNGSLQYLADWTNSTKQGVMKNLKSLIDKGLIGKNESYINNVKFVSYYTTKFNGGMQQSLMGGIQQSLPNNIDIYNINYNIEEEKQEKENFENLYEYIEINYGRMIVPREFQQIDKWKLEFNEDIIKYAIDLSILNGKKIFSYVDAILRNWKGLNLNTLQEIKDNQEQLKNKDTKKPTSNSLDMYEEIV